MAESFDITITWTCEDAGCLVQQRDWAALYLNYQDEIPDPKNPDVMIPNPVSKKQTILNKLVEFLQQLIIGGAAKESDAARIAAIESTTAAVANITGA